VSPARTRLIVNADDFGLSQAVNRGVIAAHRDGIVTSASIMVNAPAFEHALELARAHPALDIGVHLTLTELAPVAPPGTVPSLLGDDGMLLPHALHFVRRYLLGTVRLDEVRTELDAQLARARARGLAISHLDSHQHVHALPGIARVVADLAREHGIRLVRYPLERPFARMLRRAGSVRRLAEQLALSALCMVSPLRRLPRADRFVGFHFGGRLSESNLETVLRCLPACGTVELMCHPAEAEPGGPHARWGYAGEAERAALTSERIKALVRARGIELVAPRDLRGT